MYQIYFFKEMQRLFNSIKENVKTTPVELHLFFGLVVLFFKPSIVMKLFHLGQFHYSDVLCNYVLLHNRKWHRQKIQKSRFFSRMRCNNRKDFIRRWMKKTIIKLKYIQQLLFVHHHQSTLIMMKQNKMSPKRYCNQIPIQIKY